MSDYYCAKCKTPVLVEGLPKPIRSCECTRMVFVGWKYFIFPIYKRIPEKIIADMGPVTLVGASSLKEKAN